MKTKNTISLLCFLFFGLLFTACKKEDISNQQATASSNSEAQTLQALTKNDASVATEWYNLELQTILHANPTVPNPAANRLFGYVGVTLYEAARFEKRNSISLQSQLYQMPAMPTPDLTKKYSWVASANAAIADITRNIFPGLTDANKATIDSLEKAYNDKVTSEAGADVAQRSSAFGKSIAAAIFGWSQTDLFNHINDPYTPPVFPGAWVPTPPLFVPAAAPYLEDCRPFMRMHNHGRTIPPPFKYSTEKGSDYYAMVNHLYKVSQSLTEDQKNIALYWNDVGPGLGFTPLGHAFSIITQVLHNSNASLAKAAEAYSKAGIANWDALIVCFRSKYQYNQQRPVTYIQQNINSTWLPLIGTPPHPEYPAAHSFVTSSVMEVLSSVIGRGYNFTDHTYDFRGFAPRTYSSFKDAAREAGQSRLYGGIHYQQSIDIGTLYGELIGKDVAALQVTN